MIADHLTGIQKFEADLWKIADDLRANSGLASNEYFMPILGLIFLRHATNRFYEAEAAIEADKAASRMPNRRLIEADFTRRRALMLPEAARYDVLLKRPKDGPEKVKGDKRLPFGLPGVNKEKKVSNANYLWLSYFYSYLNKNGRAGVVMSSQAASAGRDEAIVRQKLVETGAVDVMIDIRGNFFYTRTVPCQLWFFDRAKEKDEGRRDHVLMLDARNIFRKVSRSVCDFSPEQQKNIAAIVWLYRGQSERFLRLVESYLAQAVAHGDAASAPLVAFDEALRKLVALIEPFVTLKRENDSLAEPWPALAGGRAIFTADIGAFGKEAATQATAWRGAARDNAGLNAARLGLHPLADSCRDLTKQVDLAAKLADRVIDTAVNELDARDSDAWRNGDVNKARKALEAARADAVETLRGPRYFLRQADWLQERFPEAKFRDVEGLVKLVDRETIKAHDWSLTPGRYVGVAPEEEDKDFDFEEVLRAIHIDLNGLNEEAAELAARIAKNFEELGV